MKVRTINVVLRALTVPLLMLLVMQTSFASEAEDLCEEKIQAKDFKNALPSCVKAAEEGDSDSQFRLAYIYDEGRGVKHNDKEAVKWYTKSAIQGVSAAQNNLGLMYKNGRGVTKKYEVAVKWFRLAADQGETYGQDNLGGMFENGFGVTQNYEEAAKWYKKAAEEGFGRSQFNLARLYIKGLGVKQDYSKAVNLLRQLESDEDIQTVLAKFIGEQSKLAEGGDSDAQLFLGLYLLSDKKKVEQGISWIKKAANQNNAEAQFQLANIYSKSPIKAFHWFNKAKINGSTKAMQSNKLAYTIERDVNLLALRAGENTQLKLAKIYRDEVPDSEAQTFFWLDQAKKHNSKDARLLIKGYFFPEQNASADSELQACLGIVYQLMDHEQNDVAIARYASCSQSVNQGDEITYLQFGEHLMHWVLKGTPDIMTNMYSVIDNKGKWEYGVFDDEIVTSRIVITPPEVVKKILRSFDSAKNIIIVQAKWMRQIYKNMSSTDIQRIIEFQSRLDQNKYQLKKDYSDWVNLIVMAPILARTEQLLDKAKPVFFGASDEDLMDEAAIMYARLNKKMIMSANKKNKNIARRILKTFKKQAGDAKIKDLEVVQVLNGSDLDKKGADRWFDEQ